MNKYLLQGNKLELKSGDEIYACNCGEGCCDSLSGRPGKCTCGNDMVWAKVTRVTGDAAYLFAGEWPKERAFKTVGKYVCGSSCDCDMISQNPGKCVCGEDLKIAN
jgi:hypothetical protein